MNKRIAKKIDNKADYLMNTCTNSYREARLELRRGHEIDVADNHCPEHNKTWLGNTRSRQMLRLLGRVNGNFIITKDLRTGTVETRYCSSNWDFENYLWNVDEDKNIRILKVVCNKVDLSSAYC